MERGGEWIDHIHSWKHDISDAVAQIETISRNQKSMLQLHLETHPVLYFALQSSLETKNHKQCLQLPFQPSPVLVQLLQNDRRRRSGGILTVPTKQRKLQLKSADYLDRKFESEIRQHYELENAQNCGKWKQFHFQASGARRQLASGIERDFRQFCYQIGTSPDEERLDELDRRLQIRKEVAENKRKEGMQWIARQCAHLFAQLDCKETEARVVAMVLDDEFADLGTLRTRISEIVTILEKLCNEQNTKKSNGLPRLPSSKSEKRLQQKTK
ncbi:uncharacterized protein IUM83_00654 [Phytophthora cinnamomi]|uniref:uncharacterized protein n=1 Tax=Phytophthora cinnamomi TaxID=4785 RepID=UPI003559DA3C|nr:hypothetical protein IUM83_00654 [Phytophthora cinnamomi]